MALKCSYYGINTNNIKNIDIDIFHNKITLLCGPSGSGKSTIAIETIHNISEDELNQLMNLKESISTYQVRDYKNILPSICLRQENFNKNPRSTIATYFNIDLLFKELFSNKNSVPQNIFQFNTIENSCDKCRGIGYNLVPDILKIVDFSSKILDLPFLNWRFSSHEYYRKLLSLHSKEINIDLETIFNDLSDQTQNELIYSKGDINYKIKYSLNGRIHTKTSVYKGPFYELYEEIKKRKLAENKKKFMSPLVCDKCNGAKFSENVLVYELYGKNIGEIYLLEIDYLLEWINSIEHLWSKYYSEKKIFERIITFLKSMLSLNLNYLNLNRSIPSLSGGELQRLRLSKARNSQFSNFIYVLDEPTAGLHPTEWNPIKNLILELNQKRNTILIIEHNNLIKEIADHTLFFGPNGGKNGGYLVDSSIIKSQERVKTSFKFIKKGDEVKITNANFNNINNLSTIIPLETLIGVCGISGSGKTSFLEGVIPRFVNDIVYLNQAPLRGNSYSIVATAVNIMDDVKTLFSKSNSISSDYFTFNSVGHGQCEFCTGKGFIQDEGYYKQSKLICPSCGGKRFSVKALKYLYNNLSIHDFLCLSIEEILKIIPNNFRRLQDVLILLSKVGLGYLNLRQDVSTLSGGEAQRVKFVNILLKYKHRRVYLLDEPFRGVDDDNIKKIITLIYELIERKFTFFISEHNPTALEYCSYIIEFGPGAGINGGNILYNGEKSKIFLSSGSIIKNYLNEL